MAWNAQDGQWGQQGQQNQQTQPQQPQQNQPQQNPQQAWGDQNQQQTQPPQQQYSNQQQGNQGGPPNAGSGLKSVGGFWKRTSKAGNDYFSGKITLDDGRQLSLKMFYSQNKNNNPKAPMFDVLIDPQKPYVQSQGGNG